MAFISATFVLCERALREADGVISAIRLVDYYMAPPPETLARIPPEMQAVGVTVVGNIRVTEDDNENHDIVMTLVRPDGESSPIILATNQPIPPGKIPGLPRQAWIIAQIGVIAKQFGEHYFVISLDGVEVGKVFFTLAQFSAENPILKLHQATLTAP